MPQPILTERQGFCCLSFSIPESLAPEQALTYLSRSKPTSRLRESLVHKCITLSGSAPFDRFHAAHRLLRLGFNLAVPQKTSSFATVQTPNIFTLESRFERFLEKLNYRMTIKHERRDMPHSKRKADNEHGKKKKKQQRLDVRLLPN